MSASTEIPRDRPAYTVPGMKQDDARTVIGVSRAHLESAAG